MPRPIGVPTLQPASLHKLLRPSHGQRSTNVVEGLMRAGHPTAPPQAPPPAGADTSEVDTSSASAAAAQPSPEERRAGSASSSGVETVRAGCIEKLCGEIARLQEALDVREKECLVALKKYDDVVSGRLHAVGGSGGIAAAMAEVWALQAERQRQDDEAGALRTRLREATDDAARLSALAEQRAVELEDAAARERDLRRSLVEAERRALPPPQAAAATNTDAVAFAAPPVAAEPQVSAEEFGRMVGRARGELEESVMELRQGLLAHHIEGQVVLKRDTERRLAELTGSVEQQLAYLHRAARLQEHYGRRVQSVEELEGEIRGIEAVVAEKERHLRQLQVRDGLLTHQAGVQAARASSRGGGGEEQLQVRQEARGGGGGGGGGEPWEFRQLQGEMSSLLTSLRQSRSPGTVASVAAAAAVGIQQQPQQQQQQGETGVSAVEEAVQEHQQIRQQQQQQQQQQPYQLPYETILGMRERLREADTQREQRSETPTPSEAATSHRQISTSLIV